MLKLPFKGTFPMTQKFNDSRWRASYAKFSLLGHNGIDYGCPVGTPLFAPHDGTVMETDAWDPYGYGHYVKIVSPKEGSILGHLNVQSPLKPGATVKAGDPVGVSGNSGNSTGPHLHWGYYREPRDRDNGFNGFLDQTYWMNIDDAVNTEDMQTALDHVKNLVAAIKQIDAVAEAALK